MPRSRRPTPATAHPTGSKSPPTTRRRRERAAFQVGITTTISARELADINTAARGNDTILDALLLRLHTETACRRGGVLGIGVADLDLDRCLVRLREKGNTLRGQPISPVLTHCLLDHAAARGSVLPTHALLRYRDGRLTSRRYYHLWKRLGQCLPWVAEHGISTHWLRHTTLTWVERHYGYGIARAGHTDTTGPPTTTYIKAILQEVATALAAMTGQPARDPQHDPTFGSRLSTATGLVPMFPVAPTTTTLMTGEYPRPGETNRR